MSVADSSLRWKAWRIVGWYALFGVLWILCSDLLLGMVVHDPALMTEIAVLKGWAYVFTTAALLLFLIRRLLQAVDASHRELQASQSRQRALFDLAADGIFVGDEQGRFIDVNGRACELTGFARDELLRMGMNDLFAPQELQRAPLRFDLLLTGETLATERWLTRKDCSLIVVEMHSKRMPDGMHQAIMRDVTDRKRAEDELLASQEKFAKTFAAAPILMALSDVETGRYVDVNEKLLEVTQFTRDEVIGFSPVELGWVTAADQSRIIEVIRQQGRVTGMHLELRAKDDSQVLCWYSGELVRLNGVTHILSIALDVTANHQTDQALRASEERFRELADLLPQTIFEADATGRLTYTNRRGFDLFGYTLEDLDRGVTIMDTLAPTDRAVVAGKVERLLQHPEEYVPGGEYTCLGKGGNVFPAFINSSPIFRDGVVAGLRGVIIDLTDQKKGEEEIRRLNAELEQRVVERTAELAGALQQMESFSYSISHDLRAPLRAIDGFIQLLHEEAGTTLSLQGQHCMERISRNAAQMGLLIDDLLLFSRLGRQAINKQQIDTAQLVAGVLEDFAAEIAARQITVTHASLPICQADPILLRQVFANIIGNAVKFTARTSAPCIEIGAREEKGRTVYFVRDNGAGFPMEFADKLFGVFQRLHTQEEFAGTGVGLAIVQNIIQRHGGTIWAESAPGAGTTFSFTL